MVSNEVDAPDTQWFGVRPQLLADHRGASAEAMIDQIKNPPWMLIWPGPNSNTFVAWVARRVPALRPDLPPTAIGKDFGRLP